MVRPGRSAAPRPAALAGGHQPSALGCCYRPYLQAEFAVRRGPSQQQRVPARRLIPHCITAPNHLTTCHPPTHLLHVALDHQRPPLCREPRRGDAQGPSLAAGTRTAPHAGTAARPSSPALARPTTGGGQAAAANQPAHLPSPSPVSATPVSVM